MAAVRLLLRRIVDRLCKLVPHRAQHARIPGGTGGTVCPRPQHGQDRIAPTKPLVVRLSGTIHPPLPRRSQGVRARSTARTICTLAGRYFFSACPSNAPSVAVAWTGTARLLWSSSLESVDGAGPLNIEKCRAVENTWRRVLGGPHPSRYVGGARVSGCCRRWA